jgi:uncharacterized membrane protein YqjE
MAAEGTARDLRGHRVRFGTSMAVISQLRELVEGVSELTAQHIRLARLELAEDARFVGLRVGVIAALAPLILVGYSFLCLALALVLRRVMPDEAAFAVVGLLNLLVGGVGIASVVKQLNGRKVMDATLRELETSSSVVRSGGSK